VPQLPGLISTFTGWLSAQATDLTSHH